MGDEKGKVVGRRGGGDGGEGGDGGGGGRWSGREEMEGAESGIDIRDKYRE